VGTWPLLALKWCGAVLPQLKEAAHLKLVGEVGALCDGALGDVGSTVVPLDPAGPRWERSSQRWARGSGSAMTAAAAESQQPPPGSVPLPLALPDPACGPPHPFMWKPCQWMVMPSSTVGQSAGSRLTTVICRHAQCSAVDLGGESDRANDASEEDAYLELLTLRDREAWTQPTVHQDDAAADAVGRSPGGSDHPGLRQALRCQDTGGQHGQQQQLVHCAAAGTREFGGNRNFFTPLFTPFVCGSCVSTETINSTWLYWSREVSGDPALIAANGVQLAVTLSGVDSGALTQRWLSQPS